MNTGAATVSVLIPCWNGAKYIAETLKSALDQTRRPLEVIVVDDGSTDRSREIVESFGGIVTLLSNPGRGASAARNHAAGAARGEYLQFLDADDLLEPSALEMRVAALELSGADVAISDWCRIVEDSGQWRVTRNESGKLPAVDVPADVQILRGFWAPPVAILYRRALCERMNGWRESLPVIQDARFLLDAARVGGRFVHVDRLGGRYRQHESGSLSTSGARRFWGDVLQNAREVEALWSSAGHTGPQHRAALAAVYEHVARTAFTLDAEFFQESLTEVERFPEYAPSRMVRAARTLTRFLGYRTAASVLNHVAKPVGMARSSAR